MRCWLATSPVVSMPVRLAAAAADLDQRIGAREHERAERAPGHRHQRRGRPGCAAATGAGRRPAAGVREVNVMRPVGRPSLRITSSQASTHCAVPMHSTCRPRRMSTPVGHAADAGAAVDAVAGRHAGAARASAAFAVRRGRCRRRRAACRDRQITFCRRPYGTGDRAHLVAEPAEVEHDEAGHRGHGEQRRRVQASGSVDRPCASADQPVK